MMVHREVYGSVTQATRGDARVTLVVLDGSQDHRFYAFGDDPEQERLLVKAVTVQYHLLVHH